MTDVTPGTARSHHSDSFHPGSVETFGSPDFCGQNMNARIDCLIPRHDVDGI
ncbi:hypothetical protein [Deinococcus sp.]|uniref:hypothetical protein n=1 Tax=Deinococcus sp. TaxID=47478 RepID=UPI00286E2762|nr:hypothetical protein [Deinococcus sp.]